MIDRLQRDAYARHLCARICDERRSLEELRRVDRIMLEVDGELRDELGEQLFSIETTFPDDAGRTRHQTEFRRGWNAAIHHLLRYLKLRAQPACPVEIGLRGLANAPVVEPLVEFEMQDGDV